MKKANCWEVKKCERQAGGTKVEELGVCPVAECKQYNGVHDGNNGGRSCWAVAESLCGGKRQGSFQEKFYNCKECAFFQLVKNEESATSLGFVQTPVGIQLYLKNKMKLSAA